MENTFPFPPTDYNQWCGLDDQQREQWLIQARTRFFDEQDPPEVCEQPNRTILLDGKLIDNFLGFLCAMGEAVNGPGGYFGACMLAFDDCLFGGFGAEHPFTIKWQNSRHSKANLDSQSLVDYMNANIKQNTLESELSEGYQHIYEDAFTGKVSLFDNIIDTINSVNQRGTSGKYNLALILE